MKSKLFLMVGLATLLAGCNSELDSCINNVDQQLEQCEAQGRDAAFCKNMHKQETAYCEERFG